MDNNMNYCNNVLLIIIVIYKALVLLIPKHPSSPLIGAGGMWKENTLT